MYRGKLGLEVPKNMSELLVEAQPFFINYKEKLLANEIVKN
jgi:hypothetical protein